MAINIFEGARRIVKLITLGGILWYGIYVFTDTPYGVPIHYSVKMPDAPPVLLTEDQSCEDAFTISRDSVSTSSGKVVDLIFCFEKQKTGGWQGLIVYKKSNDTQIYKVKDPSGVMRELRAPVGATDEEVILRAQELFTPNGQASYLQELEQAFIKADDAGHTDDAQALASEIKRMRANAQASTEPNKSTVKPEIQKKQIKLSDLKNNSDFLGLPEAEKEKVVKHLANQDVDFNGLPEAEKAKVINYFVKLTVSPDVNTSQYLASEPSSHEVTEYTERTINTFVIPQADGKQIDARWWSKRWEGIREVTINLLAGLALLFAFTWAVGWILRGFMGIPRGLDKKPSDSNS